MDSRISLALANKLRMLFEREDKFLTYPLGVGFDYRYLSFMKDPTVSGLSLQEQLNNKGDFARLMNIIPDDRASCSPDSTRLLWNAMKSVLVGANYASIGLTDAENQQLKDAIAFLTDERTQDGITVLVNSEAVNKYYIYKTVYDATSATYLDEKISVESTTGTEGDRLKAQWTAYREKQLRDARDRALQDWISLGYKLQVENYQAIQRQLEPRKFLHLQGQAYLNDIELSEIPDVSGNPIGFCTTFFSPSDVFDRTTAWTRISLTNAEMDTLVQSAPADIKALFGAGYGAGDGIVSVTLEYNNIPIMRPWFRPEFFQSRCWKMADNSVVSSGAAPCQGTIPAYITSILVVRNLVVTRKKSAAQQPVALSILGSKALRDIKFKSTVELDTSKLKADRLALGASLVNSANLYKDRPGIDKALINKMSLTVEPGVLRPAPSMRAPVEPITSGSRAALLGAVAQIQPLQRKGFIDAKYRGTTIESPRLQIPPKQHEHPPSHNEELVSEPYDLPGVAVVAYLCKRVPKAPNPDMGLTWVE
ncbi:hypothetical protein AB3662_33635 [Sorangium cellulosum]|uniref:hypothetical protein n=1 Tax=Sorangium cellulosum TaxID=56 RepID=UPI003D9A57B9